MNILILGSDGQIGRALVEYLKKSNRVIEFDNYSNPVTDLRIAGALDYILLDIDFVFFLAFDVGGSEYLKKYQDTFGFISNNIKIMNNTFDSLKRFDVPFIFASSQMSMMSYSTYGVLKLIGERYTKRLNGKIARLWNVYGIDAVKERFHVINDFIYMACNGQIDMKTSGEESRQFLYVVDCCKCLDILMREFYNIPERELDISSFEWIKIIDVAKIISGYFNDCPVYRNIGEDIQQDALIEPEKWILKYWQPETSLSDGIKKIIDKSGYL